MDIDEFVEAQDVPEPLARQAWNLAEEDETEALRLLSLSELSIKGRISNSDANINGLFLITWDFDEETLTRNNSIIVNASLDDLDLKASPDSLVHEFQLLEDSSKVMSGYTEELTETLEKLWRNSPAKLMQHAQNYEFVELKNKHQEAIIDELGLDDFNLELDLDFTRYIEDESTGTPQDLENDEADEESEGEDDDEPVYIRHCDIHVTPINGLSVEHLQPGDIIYVEPGKIPEDVGDLEQVLEKQRDESGFIPAELNGKRQTDDGRLELEVQFSNDVYGTLKCRRDVTLKVPEKTREEHGKFTKSDLEEFMDPQLLGLAAGVLVVVLIIVFLVS